MADKSEIDIRRESVKKRTKKFMTSVRKFLKEKYGNTIPAEFECSLLLLETYYEQFLALSEEIDALGSYVTTSRYGSCPHPLLGARDKAAIRLESMMKEMSLTPKSQAKMGVTEMTDENPLESFIKGKIEQR
jgi:phage terminase small subunit